MLYRSGGHVRLAFDWALRLAKPRLYFNAGSVMAELLKLCPVLYQDYAPPLVSFNGGMHMVLSVGMLICNKSIDIEVCVTYVAFFLAEVSPG